MHEMVCAGLQQQSILLAMRVPCSTVQAECARLAEPSRKQAKEMCIIAPA